MKATKNGLQPKARLVAWGFEEDCLTKSDLQTIALKTAFLTRGEYQ